MNDQIDFWLSLDYQKISNYEKLLKIIQYSLNLIHVYSKNETVFRIFKNLSQTRRIFRTL